MNSSLERRGSTLVLLVLGTLVVCRLWLLPLGNSFWVDETVMASLIRNSLGVAMHLAFLNSQSALYTATQWIIGQAANNEIALRLPSLAASIGSLFVLYHLGKEAMDADAGLTLAVIHLTLLPVLAQAANARPYAPALLMEYLSIFWLLRWARSGRLRHGLGWIAFAVLAAHFHHLFVIALGPGLIFAGIMTFRHKIIRIRDVFVCVSSGIIGLLPILPQALLLASQSRMLAWVPTATWANLPIALLPISAILGTVVAIAVGWIGELRPVWRPMKSSPLTLLGALLLAPAVLIFLLAQVGPVNLFNDRYLLPTTGGCALLFGSLLRGLEPRLARHTALGTAIILINLTPGLGSSASVLVPDYYGEHWREAVRDASATGGMLIYSGLVETGQLDWLQDPEHWGVVTAPVGYYRADLSPKDAFVLPFDFGPEQENYTERLLNSQLREQDQLTIIGRNYQAWPTWEAWLLDRMTGAGYRKVRSAAYGNVSVAVFERAVALDKRL